MSKIRMQGVKNFIKILCADGIKEFSSLTRLSLIFTASEEQSNRMCAKIFIQKS